LHQQKQEIMAFKIETEIKIEANPSAIWEKLVAVEKYPDWNPFIKSIKGNLKPGEKIKVDLGGMQFNPKVLIFENNKEFKWLGHIFFKGLFDGEHQFKIIENNDGTCTFTHAEKFKGILVPFLKRMLETETKSQFETMNLALKKEVEKVA
jgi:hypothetical protein